MQGKEESRLSVGGASIILVIVVFALVIFAVLSIKASNSDLLLSKRTRETAIQYYKADERATEILKCIDERLITASLDGSDEKEDIEMAEEITYSKDSMNTGEIQYKVYMNEFASLVVKLSYDLQTKERYQVLEWKVEQKELGEYSFNEFEYWDGTLKE